MATLSQPLTESCIQWMLGAAQATLLAVRLATSEGCNSVLLEGGFFFPIIADIRKHLLFIGRWSADFRVHHVHCKVGGFKLSV
jgi:hypothetical protein